MSFLSFQEFLTCFSKDMTMFACSGQLGGYLKQYADFCSKHHIQLNLLELHREYTSVHVRVPKPAGFYRFAYGEHRQIRNIVRCMLCHEGRTFVWGAM